MAHPHTPSVGFLETIRLIARDIAYGDSDDTLGSLSFFHRARESLKRRYSQLSDGLKSASSGIVKWMNEGRPWRSFLVYVVGIVLLLGLTGLAVFLFFFLIATISAVAIGLFGSIALVGAVAALFFTSLIFVYVGAIITAVLTISSITFISVCAALIAAGWIAFFWLLWEGATKAIDIFRHCCLFSFDTLVSMASTVPTHIEKRNS